MRKNEPTETQRDCLAAVDKLTTKLGRTPSTREVADELGIIKPSARRLMLACNAKGLMTAPKQVSVGEWRVTAAGRREIT